MPNISQPNALKPNSESPAPAPLPPGAIDISALWAARFGTLTAGKVLAVQLEYANLTTGQRSPKRSVRIVVQP